ncbi:unnamed protein product [Protopolystoma xenopodis]|uniref:Uncharacterized protein n=1 Tax=Protopolystoma xenopodis TaxID=117903 RepID=A0A448XMH8_9PLAT|nr:unnamed protein product [Protopolystoma xenopodis]
MGCSMPHWRLTGLSSRHLISESPLLRSATSPVSATIGPSDFPPPLGIRSPSLPIAPTSVITDHNFFSDNITSNTVVTTSAAVITTTTSLVTNVLLSLQPTITHLPSRASIPTAFASSLDPSIAASSNASNSGKVMEASRDCIHVDASVPSGRQTQPESNSQKPISEGGQGLCMKGELPEMNGAFVQHRSDDTLLVSPPNSLAVSQYLSF